MDIVFRAWDGKNMEYLDLSYLYWRGEETGHYDFPDGCDIMLFAGFKDKHGKDIYEGDIATYKHLREEVIFENGCFRFKDWRLLKDIDWKFWEIIGNIYEKQWNT